MKITLMHQIEVIWNSLGGTGSGAILLKLGFMLALMSAFWALCELAKHIITVGYKLVKDTMRYLAVVVRGWPEGSVEARSGRKETRQ